MPIDTSVTEVDAIGMRAHFFSDFQHVFYHASSKGLILTVFALTAFHAHAR